jgi:tripartite-type tricarboxylate transporter receptor subunit TctC
MEGLARSSIPLVLSFAAVLAAAALPAQAAERYPTRPVRLVIPFPPGGSTDYNARAIQDKLSELLGEQLIVDNRSGASGQIGTRIAARSAPDGHTLLLHTVPFVTSPILYADAGYDPVKDFAPISLLSTVPMAISVHPSVPARSVNELLELAKAKPGALNFGSAGIGTNSHITGELFNLLGRTSIVPIHYKGGGPALAAAVSGEVQVSFSNVSQTLRMVEAGRLRPLAVSSLKPSPAFPSLPTVAQAGLPGFEFVAWHVLLAPAGTPAGIIRTLNDRVRAMLADPVILKRFDTGGMDPVPTTPKETAAYLKSEQVKWQRVVRERNIKAE